jgi:hypothetical protein
MVRHERRAQANVIEEVLDRLGVMREEMLILERKIEQIKPDSEEIIPKGREA